MASKITSASYQLICALFALIVVVIIFLTIPRYYSHPNGVLLSTKKVYKAASPDLVIVYDAIPVSAQIVGQINIQQQYIANEQLAQRQMIQYAEMLAAKKGANGIVIKAIDYTPPGTVPSNQMKYQLTATAIYVRGSHD